MSEPMTRRGWLASASALATIGAAGAADRPRERGQIGFCLNTSTIGGLKKIPLTEKIVIAAKAGYDAIEPWVREIQDHVQQGGRLRELARRIEDNGLAVPSSIDFSEWVVDDPDRRRKGLEGMKRSMDMVHQIGGKRLAAPPAGATNEALDLLKVAERYRKLLELGEQTGVVPEAEVWGFSRTLTHLADAAYVAVQSDHRDACILPDVFHLYKGGSGFDGLRLLNGNSFHVIHVNDYPGQPPRSRVTDAQRIYPGDGVAPYKRILQNLHAIGFHGYLSLELFNRDYWNLDPLVVARTGLEKMRRLVRDSRAG